MLRLHIFAIGRLKAGPAFDLCQDYQQRLQASGRGIGLDGLKFTEIEAPKGLTGKARQDRESALLLRHVPDGATIVVLDETGKAMTSRGFANLIADIRDQGVGDIAFLIGGADGHGDVLHQQIKQNKARTLSFGPNTWPHMLVRVMLAEQLFRAATILSGHPYHRE